MRAIARRTLKFGDRIGPVLRHLFPTGNDFVVDRRNGAAIPSPTGGGGGGGSTPAVFGEIGNSITPSRIMQMRAQVFNDPPAATHISMHFSARRCEAPAARVVYLASQAADLSAMATGWQRPWLAWRRT
ncbi:MAG TPA: hypothetical protein VK726_22210 [Acetobacteraceae bacterium]|nr:hypothetical protein [Acetobacteraceae bacterium]